VRCLAWIVFCALIGVLGCRSVEPPPVRLDEPRVSSSETPSKQPPADPVAPGPSASSRTTDFAFAKSKDDATGETKLRLAIEACDVEAVVKSEGSELIVARHANCRLPVETYVEVWRQILTAAIDDAGFVGSKIHLGWGRIASPESDTMAPVMSRRLASAVRKDSRWDPKRAIIRADGDINALVRELARPSELFPELVRIAGSLGFSVDTEHIEKVLVATPEHWPGEGGGEFNAQEKLPYDAQVVFVLNRLSN